MEYDLAVEILKDLEFRFRRIAKVCEVNRIGERSGKLKRLEYERLAEALETVLENKTRISENRDDSVDLINYYDRAKDIAENVLKGDKNDETNL